jgi:hypothetical protein
MPYKKTVFLLIFGALACSLNAQQGNSNIIIIQDPSIDTILEKHVEINEAWLTNEDNYAIDGYRIQIFEESGVRSSTMAREAMDEFSEKYPDIPIYLTWQAPNYKVRIGDFGTRMEAEGFLKRIKRDYPIAWVIRDKIKFPLNN